MNERIRQLAEQSEMAANKGDHVDVKIMMAKFAELLVEEVYDYILNATFDDEPWPSCKDVKQHFGVEE
jgi:hypothetical protein